MCIRFSNGVNPPRLPIDAAMAGFVLFASRSLAIAQFFQRLQIVCLTVRNSFKEPMQIL